MGVSFFETMRGSVTDADGTAWAIAFEVKAEADALRAFARTGEARLTGIVRAPPWTDEAPLDGTVRIGRRITYDFRFPTEDGELVFTGQKRLSLRRPVDSATRLPSRLLRDGAVIASGELFFAMDDLLPFALSWSAGVDVPAASELSEVERATLAALTRALILPGGRVPPPDDETIRRAEIQVGRLPGTVRALYRAGLAGVDGLSRVSARVPFAQADPAAQQAALSRIGPLAALLAMPPRIAHFSRRDYLDRIGYPTLENAVREPPPDWMRAVTSAEELPGLTDVEAEVVVVGTGAGGGAVAAALAEKGIAVALVEEGRYHGREDFSGAPSDRAVRFWRGAGALASVGRPPILIPLGKMVGGTTAINSGTCLRTPDEVLYEWRDEGFPEDFTPERFAPWLRRVEAELGVAPGDPRALGEIAAVIGRGAEALGLAHGPLDRNAPGCDGQGTCIVGCPTGAKRSSDVSWIPRALRAGAALYTGFAVERVLLSSGRAWGVLARGADGRALRVRAEAVVLACGSLITPLMLRENGLRLPWIGQNLSVHPAMGLWGLLGAPMAPWAAIPQGYGFEGGLDGVRFEGFYLPPELAGAMAPVHGAALPRWMDAQDRVAQFGFMVRDGGDGEVRRGPDGLPMPLYRLSPRSRQRLAAGAARLAAVMLRGGASEVLLGADGAPTVRSIAEASRLALNPPPVGSLRLLGAHPLGTCRMAATPADGVVDFDHRVFGTDNLYVVDGSVVPSSLGVNPQLTIMAMALRAAEGIAARVA